jgi:hypothetical protein
MLTAYLPPLFPHCSIIAPAAMLQVQTGIRQSITWDEVDRQGLVENRHDKHALKVLR